MLQAFASEHKISFPLLSDPESLTITDYGILHKEGVPHPGTFVLDAKGVVRAKLFVEGYKVRHRVDELVAVAREHGQD